MPNRRPLPLEAHIAWQNALAAYRRLQVLEGCTREQLREAQDELIRVYEVYLAELRRAGRLPFRFVSSGVLA